jgi:4-hydroxy-3-polyprenylbenzoate decarboxylase
LTPYLPAATREIGKGGGNVLYDCTWPLDWPKQDIPRKGAFKTIFPKEMQEKVLARWKEYGLN